MSVWRTQLRRNRYWLAGLVAATLLAGFIFQLSRSRKTAPAYREILVERSDIATSISATGTVQPENRLEIKPPIAGRAEQVLVEEGQRVFKGQVLAWISSTERAALLDAARAEGKAEVERWEKIYRPTPVVAPIAGMIIARNVESGQTFANTDAILIMSDRLTVKAQVDETDISAIKLKQPAEIVLDAYPNETVPAKVDQIAFDAKTVNNVTTYSVDVLPDRTPDFMRSGMTANVTFVSEVHEKVIVVPSEVLKNESGTTVVMVKTPNGEIVERPVQTGISDGKRTEIVEGLSEGEIVLSTVYTLKDRKPGSTSPLNPFGGRGPRANSRPGR